MLMETLPWEILSERTSFGNMSLNADIFFFKTFSDHCFSRARAWLLISDKHILQFFIPDLNLRLIKRFKKASKLFPNKIIITIPQLCDQFFSSGVAGSWESTTATYKSVFHIQWISSKRNQNIDITPLHINEGECYGEARGPAHISFTAQY